MKNKSKHPLFSVWKSMINRCQNSSASNFEWYGGKGITVCSKWDDFEIFVKDMGTRPEGFFLDRKNKDGAYSPRNCRWSSRGALRGKEIEFMGMTCSIAEWSRRSGIKSCTIRARLRSGWNPERSIITPTPESKEFRYAIRMVAGGKENLSKSTQSLEWALTKMTGLKTKAIKNNKKCELNVVKRKFDDKKWTIVL